MADKPDGRSSERLARKEAQKTSTEAAGKSLKRIADQIKREGVKEEVERQGQSQTERLTQIANSIAGMPKENAAQARRSATLQRTFESAVEILRANESTPEEISLAEQTIATLQSGFNEINQATIEASAAAAQAQFDSANQLINAIQSGQKDQATALSNEKALEKLDAIIKNSDDAKFGTSTEELQALREQFSQAQQTLEDPQASDEQLASAQAIIDAISETAGSEEERREAGKARAKEQSILGRMSAGIDSLNKSYDDFVGSVSGGGLIAALGAAAVLFTDPETLLAGIQTAIEAVINTIEVIEAFVTGDFEKGFQLLGENLGDVSGVLLTVGALLFRKVIIGALIKGVTFLFTTFGSALLSAAGTLVSTVAGAVTLPIIAIGAAIVNTLHALWEGVTAFMDVYKETGSIMEALKAGVGTLFANLLGWPLDLLKGAISWILGAFGFTEAEAYLDSFSFVDAIQDIFNGLWDWFSEGIDMLVGLFTGETSFSDAGKWILESITSLVTAPWNLLKKGIAWILELFGMEEEAAQVEEFNIGEWLSGLIGRIWDWITGIFSFGEDEMENATPQYTNFVDLADGAKKIVAGALPKPRPGPDPSDLIPGFLYEWAGLDPDTGEAIAPAEPVGEPVARRTGADAMAEVYDENTNLNQQAATTRDGAINAAVVGGTTNNSTNQVITYTTARDQGRASRYNTANQW